MNTCLAVFRPAATAAPAPRRFRRFGAHDAAALAAGFGALTLWLLPALAAEVTTAADRETIQTMADVVLVEAECRAFNVDYAKLFAFAERNGIHAVDIMPTGTRRSAFDAAYRRRARQMPLQQLCTDLAADRDAVIPGVLTQR